MKITIQKTETKEIEITFPHFRKSDTGNVFVAILRENDAIKVSHYKLSNDIEICNISPRAAVSIATIETTRQNFMQHYEKVVDEINKDFDNVVNAMALIADEEDKYLRDNFDATNEPNMDHINA